MNTLDPRGSAAEDLANVWWLMFGMAAAVYLVVGGLIVYASLRGRGTDGRGRPSRISDSTFIWVGGIIVPVLILGVLAVVTVRTTNELRQPDADAFHVEVIGHDWWWEVRYPGTDVVTANEVRVPAGQPVEVALESVDVIHSFWIPQLAGKVDMIPGQRNILRFTADEAGRYRGQCAEFCGLQHANMALEVVAEAEVEFDRWMARQERPRSEPVSEEAARGQVVFNRLSCAGCHTIRGTEAEGTLGPDLTDFGGRTSIGANTVPNTSENLAAWLVDAQQFKPGNLMPPVQIEPDDLDAIVEYLENQR